MSEVTLQVNGINCGGCKDALSKGLATVEGLEIM